MAKKTYSPIALGEIDDSTEEWLRWREHGPHWREPLHPEYVPVAIGGSDVAVIMGCSPFKSILQLFHEKNGTAPEKKITKAQKKKFKFGHLMESVVAELFKEEMEEAGHKVDVINDINMYQHPKFKFALCNLDRRIWIDGLEGILEIKTTNIQNFIKYWKNGICPPYYEWQCRYYMATMNVKFCYICCIYHDEISTIRIDRDMDIEEKMLQIVSEFVEICELGIEPQLQDTRCDVLNKYLLSLYAEVPKSETPVDMAQSMENESIARGLIEIWERRKALEAVQEEIEQEEQYLMSKLVDMTHCGAEYVNYRLDENTVVGITLKYSRKKDAFDEERFIEEHPELVEKYKKPIDMPKRDFKIDAAKIKKVDKGLWGLYNIPGAIKPEEGVSLKELKLKACTLDTLSEEDKIA